MVTSKQGCSTFSSAASDTDIFAVDFANLIVNIVAMCPGGTLREPLDMPLWKRPAYSPQDFGIYCTLLFSPQCTSVVAQIPNCPLTPLARLLPPATMATFEDGLNGSLGCILLVAFFSLMCVSRQPILSLVCMTMLIAPCRFYGCTCGQVMYYLTHYFTHDTGDHAYIKFTVRPARFRFVLNAHILPNVV